MIAFGDIVALLIAGGIIIAAIVVVVVSRRSHLRNWRFGVFYEAEDRYDNPKEDHD